MRHAERSTRALKRAARQQLLLGCQDKRSARAQRVAALCDACIEGRGGEVEDPPDQRLDPEPLRLSVHERGEARSTHDHALGQPRGAGCENDICGIAGIPRHRRRHRWRRRSQRVERQRPVALRHRPRGVGSAHDQPRDRAVQDVADPAYRHLGIDGDVDRTNMHHCQHADDGLP